MPPKVKITREHIIQAAVALVKVNGAQAINARAVAIALGCSTQPIFSNFATMDELQEATLTAAYNHYLNFLKNEAESGRYPPYKAFGMAYIRFAKEEKELFKLLFMCDRNGEPQAQTSDFKTSVEMIMNSNGFTREKAELIHLEMWSCVHGIGTMMATSFLSLDWELISQMLTDVYQGICAKHSMEENINDCH